MKNYLTPKGYKKLKDEYDELLTVERPKICDVIAWAASNGDRSENADYQYGKKRLREIDSRLRFLGKRLKDIEIVDPKDVRSDFVQFGATVRTENEEGEEKVYKVLGPDEIDLKNGTVSFLSPIGKALMGKKVGDVTEVKAPKGIIELEIKGIEYVEIK